MSDSWDATIFNDGYQAWLIAVELKNCPYPKYSPQEEMWCDGWRRAEWDHRG